MERESKKQTWPPIVSAEKAEEQALQAKERIERLSRALRHTINELQKLRPGTELRETEQEFVILIPADDGKKKEFHYIKQPKVNILVPGGKGESAKEDLEKIISARVINPEKSIYETIHSPEFADFWKARENKTEESE